MEALIVDDVLDEFVYGKLKTDKAAKIIPSTKKLVTAARKAGVPVIYACDAHLPTDPEISLWGRHAMRGTSGARVVDDLKPTPADYVFEKRVYSSFQGTGLDLLLRNLRVDTVVIVGLYTDICVRHTAADAFQRGYRIVIPSDCVEALQEDNLTGIEYLRRIYNAKITSSPELVEKWSRKESKKKVVAVG